MSRICNIFQRDQQEFVETEYGQLGLGLQLPPKRTMIYPSLGEVKPEFSVDKLKDLILSESFAMGRKRWDSSWITYQNGYGSCAAYAGKSALEKARDRKGLPRIELSGDYLYSLVNGGRDRGSMLDDNMEAIMNRGVATAKTVPLGKITRNSYQTGIADREALRFRGHEAFATPDEISLVAAIVMGFCPVIAIHVTNRWRQFDADDFLAPVDGVGNHCEHLDDVKYDTKRGCFAFRKCTSHGKSYSDDGYCWITWDDHLKTPSRYHMFYVIPTAIDDPQGDNPFAEEQDNTELSRPVLKIASSSGCGWCRTWDARDRPKAVAAGYKLVSDSSVPGGTGVPRFQLEVDGNVKTNYGYWKFQDIERSVAELRG